VKKTLHSCTKLNLQRNWSNGFKSKFIFNIGDISLKYVKQYKYLGLVSAQHLDYAISAKTVSKSMNFNLKAFGGILL
jgi:hypothetical protein